MSRITGFTSPLLLGFDELERVLDRATKSANEGYPPYNIERLARTGSNAADVIRITLAVAGFRQDELEITIAQNQLTIHGKQLDDKKRVYLHRGIAARQFQRSFVLAAGIEVDAVILNNGLLKIDLVRHQPERSVRKISITSKD